MPISVLVEGDAIGNSKQRLQIDIQRCKSVDDICNSIASLLIDPATGLPLGIPSDSLELLCLDPDNSVRRYVPLTDMMQIHNFMRIWITRPKASPPRDRVHPAFQVCIEAVKKVIALLLAECGDLAAMSQRINDIFLASTHKMTSEVSHTETDMNQIREMREAIVASLTDAEAKARPRPSSAAVLRLLQEKSEASREIDQHKQEIAQLKHRVEQAEESQVQAENRTQQMCEKVRSQIASFAAPIETNGVEERRSCDRFLSPVQPPEPPPSPAANFNVTPKLEMTIPELERTQPESKKPQVEAPASKEEAEVVEVPQVRKSAPPPRPAAKPQEEAPLMQSRPTRSYTNTSSDSSAPILSCFFNSYDIARKRTVKMGRAIALSKISFKELALKVSQSFRRSDLQIGYTHVSGVRVIIETDEALAAYLNLVQAKGARPVLQCFEAAPPESELPPSMRTPSPSIHTPRPPSSAGWSISSSLPVDSAFGILLDEDELRSQFDSVTRGEHLAEKFVVLKYLQSRYDDMGDTKRFQRLLDKFRGTKLNYDEFSIILLRLNSS